MAQPPFCPFDGCAVPPDAHRQAQTNKQQNNTKLAAAFVANDDEEPSSTASLLMVDTVFHPNNRRSNNHQVVEWTLAGLQPPTSRHRVGGSPFWVDVARSGMID